VLSGRGLCLTKCNLDNPTMRKPMSTRTVELLYKIYVFVDCTRTYITVLTFVSILKTTLYTTMNLMFMVLYILVMHMSV
jgi:hypothetical protein